MWTYSACCLVRPWMEELTCVKADLVVNLGADKVTKEIRKVD